MINGTVSLLLLKEGEKHVKVACIQRHLVAPRAVLFTALLKTARCFKFRF